MIRVENTEPILLLSNGVSLISIYRGFDVQSFNIYIYRSFILNGIGKRFVVVHGIIGLYKKLFVFNADIDIVN